MTGCVCARLEGVFAFDRFSLHDGQTWTMFGCFPELRSEGNCAPAFTAKARIYSFFSSGIRPQFVMKKHNMKKGL